MVVWSYLSPIWKFLHQYLWEKPAHTDWRSVTPQNTYSYRTQLLFSLISAHIFLCGFHRFCLILQSEISRFIDVWDSFSNNLGHLFYLRPEFQTTHLLGTVLCIGYNLPIVFLKHNKFNWNISCVISFARSNKTVSFPLIVFRFSNSSV